MTALAFRTSRGSERARAGALGALALGLAAIASFGPDVARGLVGALALFVFALVVISHRALGVALIVTWLAFLGFSRRFLIPFAGWSPNDPLLLVSPAAALILLAASRRERPRRTLLSSLAVFQLLWVLASIANPNEPSLVTGAQGALFFVAPLLWFFVGRRLTSDEHDIVLRLFLVALVPIVALGYWHTFVGLLPFEYTWLGVANVDPALVFVRGFNIRPFSTLTSPQEYGLVLAFGALALWSRYVCAERRNPWYLAAFSVTVVALFFQGSRGIFLAFLISLIVLNLVRIRRPQLRVANLLLLVAVTALLFATRADVDVSAQDEAARRDAGTAEALYRHQIEGLFNPSSTSAPLHLELLSAAIDEGSENPLGLGPSRHRLDEEARAPLDPIGENQASPESELAITMSALGIPAAVALLALYITGYAYAYRAYRNEPTALHLAWFGILVMAGDQALNGRLYFASTIVALILGALSTRPTPDPAAVRA